MPNTNELIDSLAANLPPVRRLRPPLLRCALWLGAALLVVVMLGISHGLRPDLAARLAEPIFALRTGAALVTGVLAAVSAFFLMLPDRSEKWMMLPLPAAAVWLATISYGCVTGWVGLGPAGIQLAQVLDCLATVALIGIPLSLAMYLMMRRATPLRPSAVSMCGAVAVAAVTATGLFLFHDLDASVLVLLWNLGTLGLFAAAAFVIGRGAPRPA